MGFPRPAIWRQLANRLLQEHHICQSHLADKGLTAHERALEPVQRECETEDEIPRQMLGFLFQIISIRMTFHDVQGVGHSVLSDKILGTHITPIHERDFKSEHRVL